MLLPQEGGVPSDEVKAGKETLKLSHQSLANEDKIPFWYTSKISTSAGTSHVLVLCLTVRQCKDLFW